MRFDRLKLWLTLAFVALMVSACGAAESIEPIQGPVVPTRVPSPTPIPTATPDPTAGAQIGAVFPITQSGQVTLEQPHSGTLTLDDYAAAVTFDGQTGQTLDILTRTNGELDTFMLLLAPDGREIARIDDPRVGYTDAALYGVALPEPGTHTIIVTRYRQRYGATTGDFTVKIREAEENIEPTELTRPIAYDVPQTGTLEGEGSEVIYSFAGERGDVVDITMNALSMTLDPTLFLTDMAGNVIAFNEDINILSNFDAATRDVVLPYTGYYNVIATHYSEDTGRYELLVERTGSASPAALASEAVAYLDYENSLTMYDSSVGLLSTGFYVGDLYDPDTERDVRVQTVLTFYLPPLSAPVEEARLVLTDCDMQGLGLDIIGGYNVYADNVGDLYIDTAFVPSGDARLLDSPTTCAEINATEVIQQAYERERSSVQFRLIPQTTLTDDTSDAVVFTNPRLTLKLDVE